MILPQLQDEIGQIVILVLTLTVARFIIKHFLASVVRRALRTHQFESMFAEQKREETLISIIGTALTILVWVISLVGLLTIFHVNIAGLLTGAGVVGVVVGLGAQNAIKDFVAGLFVLIENQYRIGDIVTLGDVSGVVEKITLRITKLRDLDGNIHIIPNGTVSVITNSTFEWSAVNMDISISYSSDIEIVKKVINSTSKKMASDPAWKDQIIEPLEFLRIDGFGDSAVIVKALGKVKPGRQWGVAGEFRARLKEAFSENNIEIPFPQRVIHQADKK